MQWKKRTAVLWHKCVFALNIKLEVKSHTTDESGIDNQRSRTFLLLAYRRYPSAKTLSVLAEDEVGGVDTEGPTTRLL